MKERTKSIGATRLLWSLVLGLGLALGLLWAVTPHSAVGAQAVSPDLVVDSPNASVWDRVSYNDDGGIVAPVVRTAADATPASAPAPVLPRDVRTLPDFAFPLEASRATGGVPMFAPVGTSAGGVPDVHSLNALLRTPPLPGSADLVVCMTTDRVWGIVGAGETVTVTVDGAQMGATLADGNGFFWTTLYDSSGDRPDLGGGEAVVVYHDGVQEASVTLRSITGTIDLVSDVVSGTIGGIASPISVTLYAPGGEPSMTSYSQTVSTDGSGSFVADFSGIWDFAVWDEATVAYVDSGIEVHRHVYASAGVLVRPAPWNDVMGRAAPSTTVTVTVYLSDTTEKVSTTLTTGVPGGWLRWKVPTDVLESDVVAVELASEVVVSRTIEPLSLDVDPANDRVTGEARPDAIVRGLAGDLTPLGWRDVQVATSADASGVFTLDFGTVADVLPGQWVGVFVADTEGDDLNLYNHSPSVEVHQTWNDVSGTGPTPPGPLSEGRPVTLTVYSAASDATSNHVTKMDWYGGYSFSEKEHGLPDIAPGDVVTVEAKGYAWQGVVEVMTMTVEHDLDADQFTGDVEMPTERVELSGSYYQGQLYPLGGQFNMLVTATSRYTATMVGFDVRGDLSYDVAHRTEGDYAERISRNTDGFGASIIDNGVGGRLNPPGTPYTVTLCDSDGDFKAQLTGISQDPTGEMEWNSFWGTGQRIETGDRLQARSAAGFSHTVEIPTLTVTIDRDADLIFGQGPTNRLLHVRVGDPSRDPFYQGYVPTDDNGQFAVVAGQLQEIEGDGSLEWGDTVGVTYYDEKNTWIVYEFRWPEIIAHYQMDGSNDVWGSGAIPGNPVYITVTHPVSGVIATGTTYAGTAPWAGTNGYQLWLSDGTIVPSNTVTVDFGDGYVDSTVVVTITAHPDPDTDTVTGTAPANGWLHANAEHAWGDWIDIGDIQVDAGGVYTIDFGAEGWDIQYGDQFNIHFDAERGHQTQYSFWVPAPELSVDKRNLPGHARPDGVVVYGIGYWNDGNGVATDVLIVDTLPANTSWAGDTSGVTPDMGAGGVITWDLGDVEARDRRGFIVTLDVFGLSDGDTIDPNCVVITTTTPGDYDPGNNGPRCAGTVGVWDSDVEVGVDKWSNPGDPTPGQEFEYTVRPCNNRSAATGPLWLTDTLPLSTTFVSWDSQFGETTYWTEVITTGGQLVLYAPGLPGDMCEELYLRLLLDADASISTTLENVVAITAVGDVEPGNDVYTDTSAHVSGPRYDMNTDKWYGSGVLVPGGWINYGVGAWNQGNSAVHVWITDTLPPGTSYRPGSARECDGGPAFPPTIVTDGYVVWDFGVLDVNEGFRLDFTVDISDTAPLGPIANCATVGITATEDTPWDNTACVTETVYASGPNLYVTKESEGGQGFDMINYHIYFGNRGDQTVYNAVITDTFPISTTYDWHNVRWWDSPYTATASPAELVIVFERMEPDWNSSIDLGARLDAPNTPMRWYTNSVEITTLSNDGNPIDNTDTDVVFSSGEVQWVELNVGGTNIWGCGYSGPATVTTAYEERIYGDCWDDDFNDSFLPGDVVTIAAGAGIQPVVIEIPDPFDVTADSNTDTVWGQIDALDREWIEVDLDDGPTQDVQTDGSGNFSATFPNIPRGGQGEVRYRTEIDYADVTFHRHFQTLDLILHVDYWSDDVYGNYEAGHTLWLTVTENDSTTVKATAVLTTGPIPWWGGQSGFNPQDEHWLPHRPDIEPGDWVFGLVDNGRAAQVHIGTITGTVDVDNDSISGRIYAPWFAETLYVDCHEWAGVGAPSKDSTAGPNGDPPYFCQWDPGTEWDVQPGQDIGVWYIGSDLNWVGNGFREPQPYLTINKSANGNPAQGGNFVFNINYWNGNDDRDYAENVVITDTLLGWMTYLTDTSGLPHTGTGAPGAPLIWDLGTVAGNRGGNFDVFVQITAVESDSITNTVQIATSTPYDQGEPWEKESWWGGHVEANDTHVNVGKSAWTGDPAPGYDLVYSVNVCNNGSTASSQVTLTDTLHPSTTLQYWWGQHSGWVEVASDSHQLVVSRPSIPGWWCGEVYLRVNLDGNAWPGMSISNTVVISAASDLESYDNQATWWGGVSSPHANLHISKQLEWGQLVPGGEIVYGIRYDNNGNVPVDNVLITDTLPVSTTFSRSWLWTAQGEQSITPIEATADYVVWDIGMLDNGYGSDLGVALAVGSNAPVGAVLTNTAEISPEPDEDRYDDNTSTWVEMIHDYGPNLRVDKYHRWEGENRIFYGIWVRNLGTTRMENIWITDTYPLSTTSDGNLWVGHGPWYTHTHNAANRQFVVWAQALNPGETGHFGFWADLEGSIHGVEGLVFTDTVEAPWLGDVYPADNTEVELAYTGPDVYIEKWLSGGEPRPGGVVTFTVEFGNRNMWPWDGDPNYGSHITDTLPAGMRFISASYPWRPDQPWAPETDTDHIIAWSWGTMWSNWVWQFDLVARITDTVHGGDVLLNVVEAYGDSPDDVEPIWENNAFTLPVTIIGPKFEIGKDYEGNRVAGKSITYTLTVTNVGNETATGVVVSDTVPAYLEDVSTDGTLRPDWMWWLLGPIAPYSGTDTAQFHATLPCTAGLSITNADYGVRWSDQGVSGPTGAPVSFTVLTPTLVPTFIQSATTIDAGATVYFTDTSTTNGTDIAAWAWDFGDGGVGSGKAVSHTYGGTGAYTVTLTITDACGISNSGTVPSAVTISKTHIYLPLVLRNH
jgi:uncharacterized repeat protein (TIGR01451 family)